jgi:beta-lactamase class A
MNEKIGSQTVGELLSKMVNRSDNNAWEAFYKRLGSKRVENFARAHGAVNFNASSNMTTPEDLVEFLSSLYRGEILPPEQRNELLRLMKGGTTNQEDLLSPAMGGNSFFHKYGMYDTSLSDVGIVEIKGKPYAIAMTTNGMKLVDDNGLSKNNDMNIRTQAFHDIGQTAIQGLEHLQTVQ